MRNHSSAASRRACPRWMAFCAALLAATRLLAADLPAPVAHALKTAEISLADTAIVVRAVDASEPLLSLNGSQPMNPASAMKLLTTYAAFEILGPAHSWTTEALADSVPQGGRINGNLYLRGSGDPRLALEQFWLFLRQLRARGVSDIRGDLVLDRTAFDLPPHDPAEFDNEPLRPYNVGPDALLVNLKSLRFLLRAERGAVEVISETPGAERRLDNRLQLAAGGCGDWREKLKIEITGETIVLRGEYAAACGEKTLNLSPWPADLQVERLFRTLWREMGGTLGGQVRAGSTPPGAHQLAAHESPPLADIVREINKYSNNVMARQLFLTLDPARPATPEGATRRIRGWLRDKGLDMPELILDNGSGLSRKERISADNLARLLQAAWQSPVMPELVASLPLAGVDGTLKKRLLNGAANGRAHLKTGYLDNVRALAGYVLDNSGKRWIVVFMINGPRARLGKPAMDALLEWLASQPGAPMP